MFTPESVAGVLFSSDRSSVLLTKRRDVPVWVLPGGGIEPGEPPETAIEREMLEETGYRVQVTRLVGAYTPINRLSRPTHLYECEILSGHPILTPETRDIRFFPLNALPAMPPPYPEWIQEAHLKGPLIQRPLTSVNYPTLFRHLLFHPTLVLRFLLARAGLSWNSK